MSIVQLHKYLLNEQVGIFNKNRKSSFDAMTGCTYFCSINVHTHSSGKVPNITEYFKRRGISNPRSPGGSFMVQKMAITSPIPVLLRVNNQTLDPGPKKNIRKVYVAGWRLIISKACLDFIQGYVPKHST